MAVVERVVSVAATPAEIWAVLSDFAGISRWAPNVDHSSLMTERAIGVGSVRRIQTAGATVLETIERWEPEVGLSYEITGLPPVIRRVSNTWRLEADGEHTNVSLTTEIDAGPRPPQKLVAKAVGRKLGEASDQMLSGLCIRLRRNRSLASPNVPTCAGSDTSV